MRVLVVDDERLLTNSIKKGLEQEKFAADVAYNGTEGFDLASSEDYDVIILDLMLPGVDGLTICRRLRQQKNNTPILILTAKALTSDKVFGLNSGADDYLTKPFSFEELLARVKALVRRPKDFSGPILQIADLTLDPHSFRVTRGGSEIKLTTKEFSLMEYLLRHQDKILSKEQIISHVWDYGADILPNTVEVTVKNLRAKIDLPFKNSPPLLHTERGFGYRLVNPNV